jgi:hypothetical protein
MTQRALIDDEQAQGDGEESGRQPNRAHPPGHAGSGADDRTETEGENQRTVLPECATRTGLLLDEPVVSGFHEPHEVAGGGDWQIGEVTNAAERPICMAARKLIGTVT